MRTNRRALVPAAVAAAAPVLGCGSGEDRASAWPTTTPSATAAAPPQATAPPRPAPTPVPRPGLRLRRIGTFDSPLYVTAPPGDRRRIFVVEQGGRVRIVRGGRILRRPFLDISGR